MGYILPIQQDTYTQYVNRSVSVQQHYAYVLPTSSIKMNNHHQGDQSYQEQQKFAEILRGKMEKGNSSSVYTGKGTLFNECV